MLVYVLLASETLELCTVCNVIASFLEAPDQYTKSLRITTEAGLPLLKQGPGE